MYFATPEPALLLLLLLLGLVPNNFTQSAFCPYRRIGVQSQWNGVPGVAGCSSQAQQELSV
jgi:hypothetical protein